MESSRIAELANIVGIVASFTEREKMPPTTFELWRSKDIADYRRVRQLLADAQQEELLERSREGSWRWRITSKGMGMLHCGGRR